MTASGAFDVVDGAPVSRQTGALRLRVAHVEQANTVMTESDGDLWPSAWADDDGLYTAAGDGTGFARRGWSDIVVNRVDGTPVTGLAGERLSDGDAVGVAWDAASFNRKPTGMVAVDGDGDGRDELYLAVQDLRMPLGDGGGFDEAPTATIVRSDDYGRTWSWPAEPLFREHVLTTVMFLDLGRSNGGSPWVYAFGIDGNWRTSFTRLVPDPTALFLARVPASAVQDSAAWEFFAGVAGDRPLWTPDRAHKAPVLVDERIMYPDPAPYGGRSGFTTIAQGGVVWNPGLGRYLYSSWSEYTHEFYEAPAPWGPWRHLHTVDYGHFPWHGPRSPIAKHGGYAPTMPSKFISDDGRDLWLQSNWFFPAASYGGRAYSFGLRRVRFDPGQDAAPPRPATASANLALSDDTWPLVTRAGEGRTEVLNDGRRDRAEDSGRGPGLGDDVWGYEWPSARWFDRVVYVPGPQDSLGGWFTATPRVEVRRDGEWSEVVASVAPSYPGDFTALEQDEYVFDFEAVCADGVRIAGEAGGFGRYTSVAELEVYYSGERS